MQIPRLYLMWPTVGRTNDDRFALQLLAAIAAGPRTSRLTQALVYERQAAAAVATRQETNENVGEFLITITPRPGHSLTELESAADDILDRLKKEGPTAEEIQRATAGLELNLVSGLQSNLAKALRLADGAGFLQQRGAIPDRLCEIACRDGSRCEESGQQISDKRTGCSEHRPEGQDGSGVEARGKQSCPVSGKHDLVQSTLETRPEPMSAEPLPCLSCGCRWPRSQSLDRTKIPPPAKPPVLRVPTWTKSKLSNGAELVVSEKHDLPLVSLTITFIGGSNQFEPADRAGLAGIVAAMMSDGTKTRDGDALSNALQLLGVSINTAIGGETGAISFLSTSGKFEPALEILADMLVNSTFPENALERQRAQRLVALSQARDRTAGIAGVVFPKVLFGNSHPYGRSATERSIKAITHDEVVAFHKNLFPAGPRHRHRSGRRHRDDGQAANRAHSGGLDGRRREAQFRVSPAPKFTPIDHPDNRCSNHTTLRRFTDARRRCVDIVIPFRCYNITLDGQPTLAVRGRRNSS